jgi:hypothetical protein
MPSTNYIKHRELSFAERLAKSSVSIHSIYQLLRDFILSLGDDVQEKELHLYTAFKRMKNFACVSPNPSRGVLIIWVKIIRTALLWRKILQGQLILLGIGEQAI